MKIQIYQINMGRDYQREAFRSINERNNVLNLSAINSSIYDCVFSGEVDRNGLEEVFQKFN